MIAFDSLVLIVIGIALLSSFNGTQAQVPSGQQQRGNFVAPPRVQQPQQPQQMRGMTPEQRVRAAAAEAEAARKFAAQNEVHDTSHIQEHLDGRASVDTSKMTHDQLQFHYFTMHDLNKDNKLDGLELIKAITHWHGEEGRQAPPKVEDGELEDMIDSILRDDDYNNDGFVDYPEFLRSQAGRSQADTGQAPSPQH